MWSPLLIGILNSLVTLGNTLLVDTTLTTAFTNLGLYSAPINSPATTKSKTLGVFAGESIVTSTGNTLTTASTNLGLYPGPVSVNPGNTLTTAFTNLGL